MANPKTPDEIKAAEAAAKEAEAAAKAAAEAQAEADELAAASDAAAFAATQAAHEAAAVQPITGQTEAPATATINLAGLIVHKPIVIPAEIKTTTAANGTVTAHFGGDVEGDDGK